jgi:hypothetical protein
MIFVNISSYAKAVVKFTVDYVYFSHTMLTNGNKFCIVYKYVIRFVSEIKFELWFDFKFFAMVDNIECFLLNFGSFSYPLDNFTI